MDTQQRMASSILGVGLLGWFLLQASLCAAEASSVGAVAPPSADSITADAPLIGVGRALPGFHDPHTTPQWRWLAHPDGGHSLHVRVTSPGALGLRLGLHVERLPGTARVRLVSPGGTREITGATINASLQADRAAAPGPSPPLYWLPLVEGETLTLDIDLDPTVAIAEVRIGLRLSHFTRLPYAPSGDAHRDAQDCEVDVRCHPAWDRASRATASVLHTRPDGGSGVCSGTLLADADPATDIPYLLTAHHCVPDQARASSLETYWLHRAQDCGGPPDPPRAVTGGADLLYAAPETDTAFLRLRQPPPEGVHFAGWTTRPPAPGAALAAIHHPIGQPQRIALGARQGEAHCDEIGACADDPTPSEPEYWTMSWARGVTAPGSSGSGVFLADGRLVGTLYGGTSRCGQPDGLDDYGRFDLAYHRALHRWLGP